MIASLRGTVLALGAQTVHLDVQGVGYRVHVTPRHALDLRVGDEAYVITHLVVREDAWTLFGFRDDDELEIFEHLISVSGVGPKSALGVLSQLSPDDVARAVTNEDVAAFKRVSGIGPKSAGLIIVSLKGKIVAPVTRGATPQHPEDAVDGAAPAGLLAPSTRADVVEALVGLGYAEKIAGPAVDDAAATLVDAPDAPDDGRLFDVASLLRAALRILSAPKGRR
ncbi:Holliday junction ATP-dependent DNA helicase RuvA [Pseudoclavibacter endophyticus]|uniref:Holliday junction branch migration complex subunit RuvA n=1 Tax=Pseudoclavibacter endophyticus TaxID=1778590 RepID=A0A6H9WLN4_9MICO|nr:Holliday junction branch migration protein RuvA [Pseudoclavibacter endophyticus]KAB1650063.1 Holliday junction branch migration protein RuvA [Pseudoclavibacter endophyticus]GGA57575.1 Holliday junction ATP-dependent DNA helicase RuvA [Pseudoclavibacter endophyticus]